MFDESKAWSLAEKVGTFTIDFGEGDTGAPVTGLAHPDAMPWTLTFVHAEKEHHFGGFDLDGMIQWALDFVDGKVAENGLPLVQEHS